MLKLRSHPWIPSEVVIRGFAFDLVAGDLKEVTPTDERWPVHTPFWNSTEAGWHQLGGRLQIPDDISLLHLPPYSPELNPVENI